MAGEGREVRGRGFGLGYLGDPSLALVYTCEHLVLDFCYFSFVTHPQRTHTHIPCTSENCLDATIAAAIAT